MAQVSVQYIKPEVKEKLQSLLVDCINRCAQASLAADFVDDLLTNTEKIMISKRIGVALMLLKHVGAREISDKLKVSFPTIYRVKTWLEVKGSGYRTLLETILKEDAAKQRSHQSALEETESSPLWFGPTNWKSQRRRQWEKVKQTEVPF
ncbi:hypothetical protein HYU89_04005 [Candidatus Collierbacteria bacterium]|nr:hypothetical protein [Candidatus Collierbacteria bacterium]